MATPFVLTAEDRAKIAKAVDLARKHPVPIDAFMAQAATVNQDGDTVTLADRPLPRMPRPHETEPRQIVLPFGFRLAVSCEEQPAGICLHLSLSAPDPIKRLPHPEACRMVAEVSGVTPDSLARMWIEEFLIDGKPGGKAWNAVFLLAPAQGGHA